MRQLWTPWRLSYVTGAESSPECLFCWMADAAGDCDRERLVLYRGKLNLVAINRFPYNSGHVMVAPYEHVADLQSSSSEQLEEMVRLARRGERILREAYSAHGFNVGINVGSAAGAGVANHLHMHVVPRWRGDTNFMAATAETRVVPELPDATWERLHPAFEAGRRQPD